MKKVCLITVFLFSLNTLFAQWTKIKSIPSTNIIALAVNGNTIYAASDSSQIYKSNDGGVVWNTIMVSNNPVDITSIIFYHNKIYIGTFNFGVFFSPDNGSTWQNNGPGPLWISNFAIKNNVLYATTLGNGVAVLDSTTNSWSSFNNSLPSYSVNVQGIISSANFLLIAAGANGTFYRYNSGNNRWNEEYYDGRLHPGLWIDNIINAEDTIFAVSFNRIIRSDDAGLSWTNDNSGTQTGYYRNIRAGINNYYTLTDVIPTGTWIQQRNKYAAIGSTWANNEEFLPDGFAYDIIEFNNKLFLGKADGLYFKNLMDTPLPVHFISFNVKCEASKIVITWKTGEEQNSSHFDIEKSTDGVHWIVIGDLPAAGNSTRDQGYLYADNSPVQSAYYRIAEYDLGGRTQYTGILRSSCTTTDVFSFGPNPFHETVFVNIVAGNESQAVIKIFDGKGALVKVQMATVLPGSNQLRVDMKPLANGIYHLSVGYNNGQFQKTMQVLKQ